jgi:ubiquinone biosynthesis protein
LPLNESFQGGQVDFENAVVNKQPSSLMIKISSIPQIYRNVKRWTDILSVLSKYGLADWISRLNIDFAKDQLRDSAGEALARHTREVRVRMALTELGPTFIKLGQLLSTRPDLVGVEQAEELKRLQADVPADPFASVKALVEAELGQPLDELFAEFEEQPIASASIGQVHRATLLSGQRVVVKVQHANIEKIIRDDLDILAGVAQLAEHINEFKPYRPVATAAEMSRTLRRELDFGREERNLYQFAVLFADNESLRIPKPHTEFCTARVLTMELIEGVKLDDPQRLVAAGFDLEEVARRGAEIYLEMIFEHGFFHADPHPGNIVLLPGNVIGLLDFGMVGRIDERLREDIEEMLMCIVNRDVAMLTAIIKRVGRVPPGLDEGALAVDLADYVGQYSTQSLDDFDLSGALEDMVNIVRRHKITLPAQVAMLIKVLVTLEGTTHLLSPKFSLMEVMKPYQKTLMLRRLSPVRQMRKMRRLYMGFEQLAEVLPQRVIDIMDQVQAGKFDIHLDHRRLGPSVNRLVLGMLTSSLFVGSALMLSYKVPPLLFPTNEYFAGLHKISILGLLGCFTSLLVGLRLMWAIAKSGHLDQKE